MRMWKVDPSKMCRKHLLGEHVEMHMFVGTINKGISVRGYISAGLVEVSHIPQRHDILMVEMLRRKYKHNKDLPFIDWTKLSDTQIKANTVDIVSNEIELHRRCKECKF